MNQFSKKITVLFKILRNAGLAKKNEEKAFEKFIELRQMSNKSKVRFKMDWDDRFLIFTDATITTEMGHWERDYLYHLSWASRILAKTKPNTHTDIGSHLHFACMMSAFCKINFYDMRPIDISLDSLTTDFADLNNLPFSDNSIPSLSCLHVLDHPGLGRYGDKIDYDADLKSINELKRVLAKGGNLLYVVPIGGTPRIQFNAHRIFSYEQTLDYFSGLKLREFSLIPENPKEGGLIRNASKELADAQFCGSGCFWFTK